MKVILDVPFASKLKLMAKLRADRQRRRTERMRISPSTFAVQCLKRDKAQAALDRWEKKAKIAATYIKKYRRRLNYYQLQTLEITMARHGHKKIATWKYTDGMIEFEIPVYMINQDQKAYGHSGDKPKTYFQVKMDDPEVDEEDVEIDKLRDRVFTAVKAKLQIEWRDMLHVRIRGDRSRLFDKKAKPNTSDTEAQASANVDVYWQRVQITTLPNGKKVHRDFQCWVEAYESPFDNDTKSSRPARAQYCGMQDGWPQEGKASQRRYVGKKDNEMYALIADTPDNRRALEEIAGGMEQLYEKLATLLKPANIEDTLKAINAVGFKALPTAEQSQAV